MKENSRDIDSELIKKAKKGNHGAFNILMNKYYPRVYASIFSFIKSKKTPKIYHNKLLSKFGNNSTHLEEIVPFSHGFTELPLI